MTQQERMRAGLLWTDDGENMELQRKSKDLMYEFNHTRPSEEEKRNEIAKELFGYFGEPAWWYSR